MKVFAARLPLALLLCLAHANPTKVLSPDPYSLSTTPPPSAGDTSHDNISGDNAAKHKPGRTPYEAPWRRGNSTLKSNSASDSARVRQPPSYTRPSNSTQIVKSTGSRTSSFSKSKTATPRPTEYGTSNRTSSSFYSKYTDYPNRHSNASTIANNGTSIGRCPQTTRYETYSPLPAPARRGDGPDYARSCNAAWQQWQRSSVAWWSIIADKTLPPPAPPRTSWLDRLLGTLPGATVGSDGFTWAPPGASSEQFVVTSTQRVWTTLKPTSRETVTKYHTECFRPEQLTKKLTTYFPAPRPVCKIKPKDCSQLRLEATRNGWERPSCDHDAWQYDTCHIWARKVDVYYWPEVDPDFARNNTDYNNTTAAPRMGQPRTLEVDGYTFTSPSVYLKILDVGTSHTQWADGRATVTGGQESFSYMLPIPPESLSSIVYKQAGCDGLCPSQLSRIFNTHWDASDAQTDFTSVAQFYNPATVRTDGPPNVSAYFWGKVDAGYNTVSGYRAPLTDIWYRPDQQIIYDNYIPQIAVPKEIRGLHKEWKSCGDGIGGIYDPPIALSPRASIVVPTVTHPVPTTEPPAPGSTAPPSVPKTTNAPKTTSAPQHTQDSPETSQPLPDTSEPTRAPVAVPSQGVPPSDDNLGNENADSANKDDKESAPEASEPKEHKHDSPIDLPVDPSSREHAPKIDVGKPAGEPPHNDPTPEPTQGNAPQGQKGTIPGKTGDETSVPGSKYPPAAINYDFLGDALQAATKNMPPKPQNDDKRPDPVSHVEYDRLTAAVSAAAAASKQDSSNGDTRIDTDSTSHSGQSKIASPPEVSRTTLRNSNGDPTATAIVAHGQTATAGGAAIRQEDGTFLALSSDGRHIMFAPLQPSSSGYGPAGNDDGAKGLEGKPSTYPDSDGSTPQTYTFDSAGNLKPITSNTSHGGLDQNQSEADQKTKGRQMVEIPLSPSENLRAFAAMFDGDGDDDAIGPRPGAKPPSKVAELIVNGHKLYPGGPGYTVPPSSPSSPPDGHAHTISISPDGVILVDGKKAFGTGSGVGQSAPGDVVPTSTSTSTAAAVGPAGGSGSSSVVAGGTSTPTPPPPLPAPGRPSSYTGAAAGHVLPWNLQPLLAVVVVLMVMII